MYGIVMMTAMTAGVDAPAFHPHSRPAMGCYGCGAGCFGSSYGCGGCYGSGHGHKHGGGLFGHHRASCHGCAGLSCAGWSCFGSGHGCNGAACFGGGCYGRGHFNGCWGPSPAQFPNPPMSAGPMMSYSDPWAVYGRVNAPPTVVVPALGTTPSDAKPMETPVAPKPKEGMGANLKFKLPVEAKLYVDGRLTMIGGKERSFTTPPLAEGSQFYYDVRAEVIVDGKPVVEVKRVLVEAGATISESFPVLIAAVEGKSTPVAGK